MEDWALIRRLVADGVPQRQVARDLGVGRSTVARAVASDRPPKYERAAVPTAFTPFEPLVRQLLKVTPDMPATVIAERVGWTGSITWLRDHVRRLRPEHWPVDPADRLTWLPGDAAQCDLWFPPRKIPLEDGSKVLLPVLVITCAHSRFMLARMIPTRHTADLLLGMGTIRMSCKPGGRKAHAVPNRLFPFLQSYTSPVAFEASSSATIATVTPARCAASNRRSRAASTSRCWSVIKTPRAT